MAGQLAVTARKSIPVENRSGRVFMMAGVSAAVIATSQWAHWMGYADWDLLSIIPGFAQVSGLLPNAYADGRNFDCPNKTLGAEIALMSDEMLKTVGKTLCTKEELIAASLRGSDGRPHLHSAAFVTPSPEALILPLMPLMSAQPRLTATLPLTLPARPAPVVKSFTMASIEPAKPSPERDLIDTINQRARQVEDTDPCAGGKILAGCEFDGPGSGGGGSGGGSSGDGSGTDTEDHSGSGGDGSSGSGHDDNEWSDSGQSSDSGHSGGGTDGGEGGEGSHDGSGDHADGGDSHGGGDSHDGGESHGGSGDGSHGGGETHDIADWHDGGESHDVADNTEHEGSGGSDYTHDDSSDRLETADTHDHSDSHGDDGHEDSGWSHGGSDGGEGGEGGGGHSGRRG